MDRHLLSSVDITMDPHLLSLIEDSHLLSFIYIMNRHLLSLVDSILDPHLLYYFLS
jgi:hypothetical protein